MSPRTGDVTPMFRTNVGPCGCGCEAYGTLRRKPWRDGVVCVKRGCHCARCRGSASTRSGDRRSKQARGRLRLAGPDTRHEEHWGGALRIETKSGAQVKPMWTAFLRAETQSELARPHGDLRPFVMTAAVDDDADQLVVFRLSKVNDVLEALAEQVLP